MKNHLLQLNHNPTTYVVGVSGGVDSVALLDMCARMTKHTFIVAHFDHGIRDDSSEDEKFVRFLAGLYGMTYETKREALGKNASESLARSCRYAFFELLTKKYSATLMTAHHGDDIIETIALNIHRGTGWRGVAVLDSFVVRPLLSWWKADVLSYANAHGLVWREDSTNADMRYTRNKIRHALRQIDFDTKQAVYELWKKQISLKNLIDSEVTQHMQSDRLRTNRYFYTHIDLLSARECLRHETNASLTRPQLDVALIAIKVAKAGTKRQIGANQQFYFTSRNFNIELIK